MMQWTSIPEVVISSYRRRDVEQTAQGTHCMTRVQVRPLRIFLRRFHCLTEMDLLLAASYLLMLSKLQA